MVLFALVATVALQLHPPPLLRHILQKHPELTLLNPAIHFPGDYTERELRDFGYWPPWLIADFDRDDRADVASVVVQRKSDRLEFGLIVVHARTPNRLQWVERLGDAAVLCGVAKGPAPDTLVPLACIECDSGGGGLGGRMRPSSTRRASGFRLPHMKRTCG